MKALILDPDPESRATLRRAFGDAGAYVRSVESVSEGRKHLVDVEFAPDAVVVALDLPGGDGSAFLEEASRGGARRAVYALIDRGRLDDGVMSMARGARDFLWRPVSPARVSLLVTRLLEQREREARAEELRIRLARAEIAASLLGKSARWQATLASIERAAATEDAILLTGEAGTEKEEAARALHSLSSRGAGPFLVASDAKLALSAAGERGTLFLPGLERMALEVQAELVAQLDRPARLRMILSANQDPEEAVTSGKILPGLFESLRSAVIHLPPLRERGEDVGLLARRFLSEIDPSLYFDVEAMDALSAHDWPGNVAELKDVVLRASRLADGPAIGPTVVLSVLGGPLARKRSRRKKPPVVRIAVGASLADVERRLIQKTLEFARGSKPKTAELLKLSLKTIYNKIKEYGLEH